MSPKVSTQKVTERKGASHVASVVTCLVHETRWEGRRTKNVLLPTSTSYGHCTEVVSRVFREKKMSSEIDPSSSPSRLSLCLRCSASEGCLAQMSRPCTPDPEERGRCACLRVLDSYYPKRFVIELPAHPYRVRRTNLLIDIMKRFAKGQ